MTACARQGEKITQAMSVTVAASRDFIIRRASHRSGLSLGNTCRITEIDNVSLFNRMIAKPPEPRPENRSKSVALWDATKR